MTRLQQTLNAWLRQAQGDRGYEGVPLIEGESLTDYARLEWGMRTSLRPRGPVECQIVDRMISMTWRLRRLDRIEADMLQVGDTPLGKALAKQAEGTGFGSLTSAAYAAQQSALAAIARQQVDLRRQLDRSGAELIRLQRGRGVIV